MNLKNYQTIQWSIFWWPVLFIISTLMHWSHYLNSDEGIILNGAWNLINGRQLYIDFFEFIPPGSFYLIWGLWKIFGVHYSVARALAIVIIFLSAIGIYKISDKLGGNKLRYFFPLLFILSSAYWPLINHNTFNIFFIIWAVYFFIKGLSTPGDKNNFIFSGLLTGLSIIFLQQRGLTLLFALITFLIILLIKRRNRLLLKPILYLSTAALLPIIPILLRWPWKILYENLVIFPLTRYVATNKLPFYFFAYFLIILFLIIWALRETKKTEICFLFYVQFFLLLSTIPRASLLHLSLILFPLYSVMPLFLEKMKTGGLIKKTSSYLVALSITVIIVTPAILVFFYFPPFYSIKNNKLLTYLHTNCQNSNYLYAGPFLPGMYFEARKLNPTPYSFLITNLQTEKQFLEAEKNLKKYQPPCAILDYQLVEKFHYNKNNPVDEYIFNNYNLVLGEGGNLLYQIK